MELTWKCCSIVLDVYYIMPLSFRQYRYKYLPVK